MPKFFIPNDSVPEGETPQVLSVTGSDAFHLARVLRAKVGEPLTLSDMRRKLYFGRIISVSEQQVTMAVEKVEPDNSEPSVKVTLFQALAKGDKFDTVVQKAVECGVYAIVPVISERCVVRPDPEGCAKKTQRWQKIAVEAAKQCGRGILPQVHLPVDFDTALDMMAEDQMSFMCYEGENVVPIKQLLAQKSAASYSFMIGPEGGFSTEECMKASQRMPLCGLGKRILRTETASCVVLSVIMYHTDNL